MSFQDALDDAFGESVKKKEEKRESKPSIKFITKNPFDRQDLTDIEDLIRNKFSNYQRNINQYKEDNNIIDDNDPKLKGAKNYRQFDRYKKLLEKIEKLKEELEK